MKTQTPNPNPCHTISLVYPRVMLRILQIIQMFMHYVIEVVLINHVNSLSFVLSVFFLQLLRYLKILHLVAFNYQLSYSILNPPPPQKKKRNSHINLCVFQETTAHPWCSGHSTSINTCRVWGVMVGVQVFKRELHTHIHLDQGRNSIL